jgi:hypothetical protein
MDMSLTGFPIFTVYETATGRICWTVTSNNEELARSQVDTIEGLAVAAGEGRFETDYVAEGEVLPRPTLDLIPELITLAVGETHVVSNLPAGIIVTYNGEDIALDGDTLEIEGDVAADYEMTFNLFPYLARTMKVTIHEA